MSTEDEKAAAPGEKSILTAQPPASEPIGDRWAVVVGVSRYKHRVMNLDVPGRGGCGPR